MKQKPLISVLLAIADEPEALVSRAFASLQKQTEKRFEAIIVLDRPERADIRKKLLAYSRKDPRFRIVVQPQNAGLAAALNRALEHATAPYCARFDADDICFPNRFATQLAYMRAHPDVDFLFAGAIVIDGNEKETGKLIPQREKLKNLQHYLFTGATLIHPTVFARTEAFQRYKYDPACRRSQDFELWMRSIGTAKFDCIEKSLIYYYMPGVDMRKRLEKLRTWNTTAARILYQHRKLYRTNIWYWRFRFEVWFFIGVYHLPDRVLYALLRLSDRLRGART